MKRSKIVVIILLINLMIVGSSFASANTLKNSKTVSIEDNNNSEPASFGDTILYPPWTFFDGSAQKWTGSYRSEAEVDVDFNQYDGSCYADLHASFFGDSKAKINFYHQTSYDDFSVPVNGYYDFILTYEYDGYLDYLVARYLWFRNVYLDTDISVTFTVKINNGPEYTKEIIIDREKKGVPGDVLNYQDTKDVVFDNIFLQKNTHVAFEASFNLLLHAVSEFWGKVNAETEFTGKLKQIKIVEAGSDNEPPTIEITQPIKAFYVKNEMKIPYSRPFIIGDIDVLVNAEDSDSGMDYIEFYIDNKLKSTDYYLPYKWNWNERKYDANAQLKIIAYDKSGNYAEDTVNLIFYLNPWGE